MKATLSVHGRIFAFDLAQPVDISIPLRFDGPRLSVYGIPPAVTEPYTKSVASGGTQNCETYTINPHCHGTHTECIGHITAERIAVTDILKDALIPSMLVSITPENGVITPDALHGIEFTDALIIRTLPNDSDKTTRNWDKTGAPYIAEAAMNLIAGGGVKHLLIDAPSVDPLKDGGRMAAHKAFWNGDRSRTITELIYVPDSAGDGFYILNLQVAPLDADAAPSRPILYKAEAV